MLYLRSALFLAWFIVFSLATYIACLPTLVMPRKYVRAAAHFWARGVLAGLKTVAGLGYEIRGRENIPAGAAIVASKHFCMWETVALVALLADPAMVLKRELLSVPLYGWYAQKQEMIPIEREARASALRKMLEAARRAIAAGRQIVIFPEGTRKAVGAAPDYKPGVAGLYAELGVPCVPVALNSGLYWVSGGLLKKPGTIVVEFLKPIPPGAEKRTFMAKLQDDIETATRKLLAESQAVLSS